MPKDNTWGSLLGRLGSVIGKGLIAGAAGTAAITISQLIEQKLSDKPVTFAPADAASKALSIEASDREEWPKFSNEVHWTYGTLWGIGRGLLSLAGVKGWIASSLHFAAIYYTALQVEPDFEVAPPLNEWSDKELAVFALHHAVYATVAGFVFDALSQDKENQKDHPKS